MVAAGQAGNLGVASAAIIPGTEGALIAGAPGASGKDHLFFSKTLYSVCLQSVCDYLF
jgi:hypothetical protein